jgi:DNA polymerase elongation subunit (family B)
MKRRGNRVEAGSRVEYLIVEFEGGHKGKQYEKIEDLDYFMNHSDVIKVDFFYYLEVLINPLDEVLNVLYNKDDPDQVYKFKKDFTQEQYNFRYKIREKMMDELRDLFRPKLVFLNK